MVLATRSLNGRELEVLRHAAGGNSNKRIAFKLDISEETVKAHMKSILSKLGQRPHPRGGSNIPPYGATMRHPVCAPCFHTLGWQRPDGHAG
jgi:hypothetical protein